MDIPSYSQTMSYKAGGFLRAIGWLMLVVLIGALIGMSIFSSAMPHQYWPDVLEGCAFIGLWFALTIAYLVVGKNLKLLKPWARRAGVALSLVALVPVIPITVVLGALALNYIAKGWREAPDAA